MLDLEQDDEVLIKSPMYQSENQRSIWEESSYGTNVLLKPGNSKQGKGQGLLKPDTVLGAAISYF